MASFCGIPSHAHIDVFVLSQHGFVVQHLGMVCLHSHRPHALHLRPPFALHQATPWDETHYGVHVPQVSVFTVRDPVHGRLVDESDKPTVLHKYQIVFFLSFKVDINNKFCRTALEIMGVGAGVV